jgi:hypothetical protein
VAYFAVVEIVIVGMEAVGTLQGFLFLIGLKRSEALFTPRRLGYVLRPAVFTDTVFAHGFEMLESRCGFVFFRGAGPVSEGCLEL